MGSGGVVVWCGGQVEVKEKPQAGQPSTCNAWLCVRFYEWVGAERSNKCKSATPLKGRPMDWPSPQRHHRLHPLVWGANWSTNSDEESIKRCPDGLLKSCGYVNRHSWTFARGPAVLGLQLRLLLSLAKCPFLLFESASPLVLPISFSVWHCHVAAKAG